MRVFAILLMLVLGGYLFFNRSFAYLHVPGTPVYIGEVLLGVGVVQALRVTPSIAVMLRHSRALQALVAFMALALAITVVHVPAWGLDAIRDAAIWYYGAFAFLVVLVLRRGAVEVGDLTRLYAWAIPIFLLWGPVVIALNQFVPLPTMPGAGTQWLAHKPGDVAVHAALAIAFLWLCHEHTERLSLRAVQVLTGVGLVTILVAGSINRGGLITAALALAATILIVPRRRTALATAAATAALLVAFMATTSLEIQLGHRSISLDQLQYNIESVFADEEERDGTVRWRLEFWERVGTDTIAGDNGLFGLGFGVNLAHLYEMRSGSYGTDQPLRNAHNSHVTLLARTGVPGALVWLAFWAVWFSAVITVVLRRSVRDSRGALAAWVAIAVGGILVNAIFDPTLEGPQVGIWLWTLVGLGCWLALPEQRGVAGSR